MPRVRTLFIVLSAVAVGIFFFAFHPHAEEVEEEASPAVSESAVQTYIQVYMAMQDDHDLTIDNAIKPFNLSLDEFRQTERRIQSETRIVERVRDALLDHAKKKSMMAQAVGTDASTPIPSPVATKASIEKKKSRDRKK